MSVSFLLVCVSATLLTVSCLDPRSTCKFPDTKEFDIGFKKVASKDGIRLTRRQRAMQNPACGKWLIPPVVSPFLKLCDERRTFTQTGNYVIFNSRFCLVSRPFNTFKYPSVECIYYEMVNNLGQSNNIIFYLQLPAIFMLLMLVGCCCGWLFGRKENNHSCAVRQNPNEKPYYFGTTNLFCMTYSYYFRREKRTAKMFTLKPVHSWMEYDGHYVEFGIYHNYSKPYNYSISITHPAVGNKCSYSLDKTPKGYSSLGIDCIEGCAKNYIRKYGNYNILLNNCHVFLNRLSKILCHQSICPSWCLYNRTM
ncbi:uncharacterized protein LOC132555906 [Ylistrum balloti]|uniref:uncharacterized protein LOC132555906 n=1 Tax=Ylistrum balloti TaxID=509963 RepID=UPI0029057F36|nr:uncharacterized protein LOC132555906 [Ylistrum balloti]